MENDPEQVFAAYLRTGDLELLRALSDRHVARLVDEGRFDEVYRTWPLSLVMHHRLEHVRRVMRRSVGLAVDAPGMAREQHEMAQPLSNGRSPRVQTQSVSHSAPAYPDSRGLRLSSCR